ncbi:MAG: S8 family serine peptidase [Pseudomonadota bacterium]
MLKELFRKTRDLPGCVLALCLFFLGALAGCTDVTTGADAPPRVNDDEIVALVNTAEDQNAVRRAALSEGYLLRKVTDLPSLGLIMLSFERPPGVTGPQAIEFLEGAVPGATVGVNHAYTLQQSAPGGGALNYADALLQWPNGGCPARGPLGLIDTGVDATVPALTATEIVAQRFFDGRAGPARHGTEIATVLSDPRRLSRVKIFSADVFELSPDAGLAAGADSLVRALDWMAQNDVRVVNLALAGPFNKLLALAVERAAARGLILIAAVGNDGAAAPLRYPAGFDQVIAVTAVDAARRIMPNAGRGGHVDVAAPGVEVLVAPTGRGRLVTGTSIATPFVAARIIADPAMMRAGSVASVRQQLRRSTQDLGPAGYDPLFGAGLLQAKGLCGSGSS